MATSKPTKKTDVWMPLLIGDFLSETQELPIDLVGPHILLWVTAWKRGGALPKDDVMLASAARLTAGKWKASRAYLLRPYSEEADRYLHPLLQQEWIKAQARLESQSQRGLQGANARWGGHASSNGRSNASSMPEPMPEPMPDGMPADMLGDSSSSSPSQFPFPTENETTTRTQGSGPRKSGSRAKPARPISPTWEPDDALRTWTIEQCPGIDVDAEVQRFRNYWIGEGKVKADWPATFRNRILNLIERRRAAPADSFKGTHYA